MGNQERTEWRWRSGAAGAALVMLVGLLSLAVIGPWLEGVSYELPFRVRPPVATSEAVIVHLDETSAKELPESRLQPEIWDRAQHARLVRQLTRYQAKAVVFDILFDIPGTNDAAFIQAIRDATNGGTRILVGAKLERSRGSAGSQSHVLRPLAALEEVALVGLAEVGNPDVTSREHFTGDPDSGLPTLAWLAAEHSSSPPPVAAGGRRWINYYGPPGWIRHYRFHDVLDSNLNLGEVFSNKVCFVGAPSSTPTARGVRLDEWNSPWQSKMPGVELTATVFLNLVRGDSLKGLTGPAEWGLAILVGILFGFGFSLCRPTVAAGLGLGAAIAVTVFACWMMAGFNVWFCWLLPAGVQIPAAVGWSVLAYTKRLAHEKVRLEEKLATVTAAGPPVVVSPLAEVRTVVSDTRRDALPPGPMASGLVSNWIPAIPDHAMVRRVGRGAYGEVWLARNAIGTYHAVKIVRREDFEQAGPWQREFRGLQNFMPISRSHPGLVQILHVGRHETEGFIYYIMEAADDESAGERIDPETYTPKNLAKELRRRGRLPVTECLRLGLELTSALEFLHGHQLIHRDIKPANIIFVKGVAKFADIGLVTGMATTGHEVTYLGTEGYIAPEGPGTPAADIYSLGKVLYQAAMGLGCEQFPELSPTVLQRPDRAELFQLNEIILKACREDLSQRYRSAGEMQRDLRQLQQRLATA